jgi:hypothetical protein
MKRSDRLGGLLFMLLAGLIAYDARRLQASPVGPGTVPLMVASLLGVAAFALFLSSFRRSTARAETDADKSSFNAVYVSIVVALYLACMYVLGYLPSTVLLVTAMLWRLSEWRLWKIVLLAALVSGSSFYLFTKLGMHLPGGLLEG